MFLKILLLIALLALGIQALPNVVQQTAQPQHQEQQHQGQKKHHHHHHHHQEQSTLQEQIAAWSSFPPQVNSVQKVEEAGSSVQQQHHATHHQAVLLHGHPSAYPGIHAGSVDSAIGTQTHSPVLTHLGAVQSKKEHDNKMDIPYAPYPYFPSYEDQVVVYPQNDEDERYSSEDEQEVWPPVGIYPPPPPPTIRPTYYPPHYPTLPTRPTPRPTVTTTRRPRPPHYTTSYPTYPKPPQYPLYPLDQLPHLPQYPRPTTSRPTTARPTTARPTTARPTSARPTTTTTTTTTKRPTTQRPGAGDDAVVLESYQVLSDKGITAYKLRMSNGLNDYKKITEKKVGNDTIYVQTGYYSVPVPGKNEFVIYRYIADERGYRITGIQSCADEAQCLITLSD